VIDANDAFMLYDTFGFPLDLTDLMAEERDMKVDHEGFQQCMEEQKRRSRGEKGDGEKMVLEAAQTDKLEKLGIAPTDDTTKYDWDPANCSGAELQAKVMAIYTPEKVFVDEANSKKGTDVGLVLDQTCYYAEAGGQVYDSGSLTCDGMKMDVLDCKKFGAYILHCGTIAKGSVKVGDTVTVTVNYKRRADSAMNHTTTHLLNYGLRQVLGDKVDQRGSLVVPDKLRFDFTQGKAIKHEDLIKVQAIVQEHIDKQHQVYTQECSLAEARAICSLRAVFGEKYPDPVRVVSIGSEINTMIGAPDNEDWKAYSVEFCGGTHLTNASQAGTFLITSEEPVSKGVRRISAVTGNHAKNTLEEFEEIKVLVTACETMEPALKLRECKTLQNRVETSTLHIAGKAELTETLKKVRKDLLVFEKAEMKKKLDKAIKDTADLIGRLKGGVERSVVLKFDGDKSVANDVVNLVNKELPEVAVFALGLDEGTDSMTCITSVPEALQGVVPANEWCNAGMQIASGKGGGKKDRAQGAAKGRTMSNKVCEAAAIFAYDKLSH